jgi:cytochrome c553
MSRGRATPTAVVLLLAMLAACGAVSAQSVSEGKAKAAQCFACHGVDGVAKLPEAPNLAGQNEAYLIKALHDFKKGARVNEMMSLMAAGLSDADIAALAAYYSSIKVTVTAP